MRIDKRKYENAGNEERWYRNRTLSERKTDRLGSGQKRRRRSDSNPRN